MVGYKFDGLRCYKRHERLENSNILVRAQGQLDPMSSSPERGAIDRSPRDRSPRDRSQSRDRRRDSGNTGLSNLPAVVLDVLVDFAGPEQGWRLEIASSSLKAASLECAAARLGKCRWVGGDREGTVFKPSC